MKKLSGLGILLLLALLFVLAFLLDACSVLPDARRQSKSIVANDMENIQVAATVTPGILGRPTIYYFRGEIDNRYAGRNMAINLSWSTSDNAYIWYIWDLVNQHLYELQTVAGQIAVYVAPNRGHFEFELTAKNSRGATKQKIGISIK